jgi:cysteine-rich repeat protein
VCGDGKIEAGVEECDDGATKNGIPPSTCSKTCHRQTCGNGILDPGEQCDKGTPPSGVTPANPNDFNDDSGDCRTDCIINRCGDGYRNTDGTRPEACEGVPPFPHNDTHVTPTETADCNINCTMPACGDNILNRHFVPKKLVGGGDAQGPEQCDDGARSNGPNGGDGCSADCQFEFCGNGIVDPGEQCDGPNAGLQPCSSTCFQETCGNGIVDPNEECDNGDINHGNGNNNNGDCRADCVINRCGDGFTNNTVRNNHAVEECDGGPRPATAGDRTASPTNKSDCNSNCKVPSCGDGFVNPLFVAQTVPPSNPLNTLPEQCDPPDTPGSIRGCSAICRLENCGNGVVDPHEQCDDGNIDNGDGCENDCTLPICGNTIVDHSTVSALNEECDDGNLSNEDSCTNGCKAARCGDGFVQAGVEDCDTTPTLSECTYHRTAVQCDVCDPVTCKLDHPTSPFCGDGHTDNGFEVCDSNNTTCGVCPDCQGRRESPAVGFISAPPADELNSGTTHDTFTFTFTHGFAPEVTFEFTRNHGDTGDNPEILLGPEVKSAADVATAITAAINGQPQLQVAAVRLGSLVRLTNSRNSSLGNDTLSAQVQTLNFAVIPMAGGAGGDCLQGVSCTEDADCESGSCTAQVCD